jgi:hypothetical protein
MTGLAAGAPKTLIFEWEQGAELPVDILETGVQIEIVIMQHAARVFLHALYCSHVRLRSVPLRNAAQ